ncbi:MAG: hypothetical protein ACKVY0_08720 [Prosthecobacter sp.]|uniref:hypothetical protein n=1 Tax=Prosthecobacter sp. TaxID=1965333 RepID=UPI0038FF96E8
MSITATVMNDTIKLPEDVLILPQTKQRQRFAERYKEFIGCVKDAPMDAADNHDHDLYGAPKSKRCPHPWPSFRAGGVQGGLCSLKPLPPESLAKPLPSAVCMFLPAHLFAFNTSRSQAWRRLAPEWKAKTWAGENILHHV